MWDLRLRRIKVNRQCPYLKQNAQYIAPKQSVKNA